MDSESRHSSSLQMSEGDSLTTRSNEEVEASISNMQRKKMKPRSDVGGHFDKIVDGAGIQRAFPCLFATMMAVSISGLYMGSKHSGANTRASDMRDFGEKVENQFGSLTNTWNDDCGMMTVAKARIVPLQSILTKCGIGGARIVPLQSILTKGGIGGAATNFAAGIVGNLLSGLYVQFSRPFTVGDIIKVGAVEGQVTEMGLTTTTLLNLEKFPIIVPNSHFSGKVIINKSRAQWRAWIKNILLQIDLEKISVILLEIKSMLQSSERMLHIAPDSGIHLRSLLLHTT